MQASEHWNDLACRIAAKVQPAVSPDNPVFISDSDVSPFGIAMRSFLKTQLQKRGIHTTENRSNSYELVWEVQQVYFNADRFNHGHGLPIGLSDVIQNIFIGGVDFDFYKPHSEIIVSFELLQKDKDLQLSVFPVRDTYVFYVNDYDRDKYIKEKTLEYHEYKLTSN
ncbi:hypothetical protein GHYDROH2_09030 [Geobacter hydrogenophilus]|uniref:Uncharacterized protein n=2 Tax=Geobacter hydrogenophilus TaxID=40983 RepID=A0A9W6FYZ4_9BACT|nr:hypothetical protein GHYDROH2_09030 [Geobacter hydrogenophilus]